MLFAARPLRSLPQLVGRRALSTNNYAPFPDKLAFAFDIDGVLKQGKFILPQAKRVMKMLTGEDGQLPR